MREEQEREEIATHSTLDRHLNFRETDNVSRIGTTSMTSVRIFTFKGVRKITKLTDRKIGRIADLVATNKLVGNCRDTI